MERLYDLTVTIGGHKRAREKELVKACMVEWGFRNGDFEHLPAMRGRKSMLRGAALSSVADDEQIEDIVARIERAVWRVNEGMCHVEIQANEVTRWPQECVDLLEAESELQIA